MPTTASWLAGTTAAITGADGDLGRAVSASLARHRLRLVLAGADDSGLTETAREVARIRQLNGLDEAPLLVEVDARTPEGVAAFEARLADDMDALDALVHVVGIGDPSLVDAVTAAMIARAKQGLVRPGGALVVAVLAGPWSTRRQREALADTAEVLRAVVRDAAQRLARVAVNGVLIGAHGPTTTQALRFGTLGLGALGGGPLASGALVTGPRTAHFGEAARIVRFLASREAKALTGHTLTVGGGHVAAA